MAVDQCIYLMNETLKFGFKNLRCDGVFQSAWGKNFGSFGIKWLGQTLWQIKITRFFFDGIFCGAFEWLWRLR